MRYAGAFTPDEWRYLLALVDADRVATTERVARAERTADAAARGDHRRALAALARLRADVAAVVALAERREQRVTARLADGRAPVLDEDDS